MKKIGLIKNFDREKYSLVQDSFDIEYINNVYHTDFAGFLIEFSKLGPEKLLGISGTGYSLDDEVYLVTEL